VVLWSWQRRIARATELARADRHAEALLTQYAAILTAQAACYDALVVRGERLTGSLERDLPELRTPAADVFAAIATVAPAQAVGDAPADTSVIDALLRDAWHTQGMPFLARIVLQPYAEVLAGIAAAKGPAQPSRDSVDAPVRRERRLQAPPERAACPFCGGAPQLAVLRADTDANGGGRALVCATCSTTWLVGRIRCSHCGEEDEDRLGYFHTRDFDHLRVDACDTCRHYLKTVDLTRLGLAVPLVDEVASGALDIWAQERGYTKVTPNLIGL
jgi:formate dehydrogenase maturation protein FdhE